MTSGTDQDDTLVATAAGEVLSGGLGDDLLQSAFESTTLSGDRGNDTLQSTLPDLEPVFWWDDVTYISTPAQFGGAGDDSLSIYPGIANLHLASYQSGGTGNDTISAQGAKSIEIHGDGGFDLITADTSHYLGARASLSGGTGADTIYASVWASDVGGADAFVDGGGGADVIDLDCSAERADATIIGGAGDDTIDARVSSRDSGRADLFVDAGGGDDRLDLYVDGTSVGAAYLHAKGGGGDDWIDATTYAWSRATLEGGTGNDTLMFTPTTGPDGGGAEVQILGGGGNDHLISDAGRSFFTFGPNETLSFLNHLDGGTGDDLIEAYAPTPLPDLSLEPDTPFTAQHVIFGGGGSDTIMISGGLDNQIDGGLGHDSIQGSLSADGIDGGGGHDTLAGLAGDDTLSGGDGRDAFVFGAMNFGVTTITDWDPHRDILDVDLTDLNGNGLYDELQEATYSTRSGSDLVLVWSPYVRLVIADAYPDGIYGLSDLFDDPLSQIV